MPCRRTVTGKEAMAACLAACVTRDPTFSEVMQMMFAGVSGFSWVSCQSISQPWVNPSCSHVVP